MKKVWVTHELRQHHANMPNLGLYMPTVLPFEWQWFSISIYLIIYTYNIHIIYIYNTYIYIRIYIYILLYTHINHIILRLCSHNGAFGAGKFFLIPISRPIPTSGWFPWFFSWLYRWCLNPMFQWIGLMENLQETINFPIKYGVFL